MEAILTSLKERFTPGPVTVKRDDLTFITIEKKDAAAAIAWLKDYHNYTHLVFLTAVDYIERGVFMLQYMLHNYETKHDIGVRVEIERENSSMDSIHHLWAQAGTYQRELKEMYGIDFPGSPRVDEQFILESWDGIPPMRREFDTKKYSEETFYPRPGRYTEDPAAYMERKLYPEEAQ